MSHHVRFAEPAWPDGSSPFRGCGDATAQAGVMLEELRPPLLPVPLVAARTSRRQRMPSGEATACTDASAVLNAPWMLQGG